MTRKINYPKHRKPPKQHNVKAHKRKGQPVRSFVRGKITRTSHIKKRKIDSAKLTRDQIFEIAADTVESIKEIGKTPSLMSEKTLRREIISQLKYGRTPSPQIEGKVPETLIERVRREMENYTGWE